MDERGIIEIRVSGSKGNLHLSPDNYDIRDIAAMFEIVENLIAPGNKKQRPEISYTIEEGSVRHIFRTGFQAVITITAILSSLSDPKNIDKLELPTARAIEKLQQEARSKRYSFFYQYIATRRRLASDYPRNEFQTLRRCLGGC